VVNPDGFITTISSDNSKVNADLLKENERLAEAALLITCALSKAQKENGRLREGLNYVCIWPSFDRSKTPEEYVTELEHLKSICSKALNNGGGDEI